MSDKTLAEIKAAIDEWRPIGAVQVAAHNRIINTFDDLLALCEKQQQEIATMAENMRVGLDEEARLMDIIDGLRAEIASLKHAAAWVPVSERLPEECTQVICMNNDGMTADEREALPGFYEMDEDGPHWFVSWTAIPIRPTHWMPLPPPPAAPKEDTP